MDTRIRSCLYCVTQIAVVALYALGCTAECPPGYRNIDNICKVPPSTDTAGGQAVAMAGSNVGDEGGGGPMRVGTANAGRGGARSEGGRAGENMLSASMPRSAGGGNAGESGNQAMSGVAGSSAGSMAGSAGDAVAASGGAAGMMSAPRCGDGNPDPGEMCDGNCPTMCPEAKGCIVSRLVGSPATCDAECETDEISKPMPGDDCCPKGADAADDSDCPASCGDGIVDANEKCEPTNAQMPCPASCDDGEVCTKDMLSGSAAQCTAACVHVPITSPKAGDDCCPSGANANTDSDCKPKCGNRVREKGETCDGDCPTTCNGGSGCMRQMLMGSECTAECKPVQITARMPGDNCCPPGADQTTDSDCKPICGNGVTEAGELCDGKCPTSCPGGSGCKRQMLSGSGCNMQCTTVEITARTPGDGCCPDGANKTQNGDCDAKCGNNVIEPGEKCDGKCTTRAQCDDGDACTADMYTGSVEDCTALCVHSGPKASEEKCDGADNDCDGKSDEGLTNGACDNGAKGSCQRSGMKICREGGWVCDAPQVSGTTEICGDGFDNDCDGYADGTGPQGPAPSGAGPWALDCNRDGYCDAPDGGSNLGCSIVLWCNDKPGAAPSGCNWVRPGRAPIPPSAP